MSRFIVIEYESRDAKGGNRKKVEIAADGEHLRYGENMVFVNGLHEMVVVPLSKVYSITVPKAAIVEPIAPVQLHPQGANHA